MTYRKTLAIVLGCQLGWGAALMGAEAEGLLDNGSFESWAKCAPASKAKAAPKMVDGFAPEGWTPEAETGGQKGKPAGVTISRDTSVVHSGSSSARISNSGKTEVGRLDSRLLDVEPERTYKLRLWYKGRDIVVGAGEESGVSFGISQGSENWAGDGNQKLVKPKVNDGTFDWRAVEMVFTTKPTTRKVRVSLQLRLAAGTVWFDDAQLIDVKGGAAASPQRQGNVVPIFQADFNGPGSGTGGPSDGVSIGGTARFTSSVRVKARVGSSHPFAPNSGNYFKVATESPDCRGMMFASFTPTESGAFKQFYKRDAKGRALLNGGFDVFIRVNVCPSRVDAQWFSVIGLASAKTGRHLSLRLGGATNGSLVMKVESDVPTFKEVKLIPCPGGVGEVANAGAPEKRIWLYSNRIKLIDPGIWHLGFIFATDADGMSTLKLFGVEGTGGINTSHPLAAVSFKVDAAALGDAALGVDPWSISMGFYDSPVDVDYDCLRVYDRDPGEFPGL